IDLNKDPSIAAHLSRANEAALRAATISRSLRGSAEQRSRGDRGVYSVAALLQQYWPVLRNLVPNSIALEHEITDSSLSIQIDPNDLLDMLMRTIENAAEASAPGGRILVKVLSADSADTGFDTGSVLLEIQDQGVGMSEHAVSNAFQAFYTTKTFGLAGLGLSDVATLVERNSAQASIESKPGLGTTVRIAFARA
ncbi:MAG: ATP-binding protein, partial [Pseudomonadales bacterium]